MSFTSPLDEYVSALKKGEKEYAELTAAGKNPYPAVLDEILPDIDKLTVRDVGTLEIPSERIIGVKSAGRITAFSASFLPLLNSTSEFAVKWVNLCNAHLGEGGIREPITCYEYLGNFYVQEGNKRVSVLRYFGSPRIPAQVKRVIPIQTEEPRIQAYYEFLEFFKATKLYCVQFRRPNDYAKLLTYLGKKPGEEWTEDERRTFQARFHYFQLAVEEVNVKEQDILPEEALLLWLQLYSFEQLSKLSAAELKKSVAALWEDMVTTTQDNVKLETKVEEGARPNLITRIITSVPDRVNVAFIQQLDPTQSGWAQMHEAGKNHLEQAMGSKVSIRSYYNADTPAAAEAAIDQAVEDGAQVIFTTVPQMSKPSLKAAIKYPKVFFFNCSVDQPYSSIRTYYGRVYEAKFITGAIAGAMAQNDRIGYIASYPIYGVPASINAFALGAQLTNPRAQIELRWSCVQGTPLADFFAQGIRVVSNRDVPVQSKMYLDFCNYGTYLMDSMGELVPLASPVWVWGKFFERAVSGILSGKIKNDRTVQAPNYWLGMDSGVIDIELSEKLPAGIRNLANILKKAVCSGQLDPFARRIVDQKGTLRSDGSAVFTPDALIHMDWLCDNVNGTIPSFEEILPMSESMVRELGIYRSTIPAQKEAAGENFSRLR